MKAEEISIGDWVHIHWKNMYDGVVSFNFRVTRLTMHYGNEILVWGESPDGKHTGNIGAVSKIEPVSLSSEILEKNGWKNKLWWEHSDVGFYMSKKTDGTWEIQTDKDSEFSTLCSIRYVHELQHLLRLCGIEKEIEL